MRALRPALALLLIASIAFVADVAAPVAQAGPQTFRRGATLVEFFQFPHTIDGGAVRRYADPAYGNAASTLLLFDFDRLRRDGFDHMRIPLDVGPLLAGRGDQTADIIAQLRTVIAALHRHGLAAVVTLFPPAPGTEAATPELDGLNGPNFQHYVAIVERIAVELASIKTGLVALEPMNEPQTECRASEGPDWTAYQDVLVGRIRSVTRDLPVFLTGGCWSSIEGTVLLDTPLLRDPHNYVSVHFYLPFLFTHQTATWAMPYIAGVIGVPYPAAAGSIEQTLGETRVQFRSLKLSADVKKSLFAEAERAVRWYFTSGESAATMEAWMAKLADWQAREGVATDHIAFTEFGAIKQLAGGLEINRDSRARWLHDAASAMTRHGWGWTVFVLRPGLFGLYANENDIGPDPRLLNALGLNPAVN